MRRANFWRSIAAGVVFASAHVIVFSTKSTAQLNDAERGMKIAQEKCARCHATGKADVSPDPKAPPFRNVGKNYPPEHLAEALAEIGRYRGGMIVLMGNAPRYGAVTARVALADLDGGIDAIAATHGLTVTRLTNYLMIVR